MPSAQLKAVATIFLRSRNEVSARSCIRFGGEVLIPGIDLGLYLNVGELADFFCGIFGLDIAGDEEPAEAEEDKMR